MYILGFPVDVDELSFPGRDVRLSRFNDPSFLNLHSVLSDVDAIVHNANDPNLAMAEVPTSRQAERTYMSM